MNAVHLKAGITDEIEVEVSTCCMPETFDSIQIVLVFSSSTRKFTHPLIIAGEPHRTSRQRNANVTRSVSACHTTIIRKRLRPWFV